MGALISCIAMLVQFNGDLQQQVQWKLRLRQRVIFVCVGRGGELGVSFDRSAVGRKIKLHLLSCSFKKQKR